MADLGNPAVFDALDFTLASVGGVLASGAAGALPGENKPGVLSSAAVGALAGVLLWLATLPAGDGSAQAGLVGGELINEAAGLDMETARGWSWAWPMVYAGDGFFAESGPSTANLIEFGTVGAGLLPAGWQSAELGAAGLIGLVSAGVAIARGDKVEYEAGRIRIGGKLLISASGRIVMKSSEAAALAWAGIVSERVKREWSVVAMAMHEGEAAAVIITNANYCEVVAGRALAAAAACTDIGAADALRAEAAFCLKKWGGV